MHTTEFSQQFNDTEDVRKDFSRISLGKQAEPTSVVRQYINPAVYVESSVYNMAPFKRSPVFLNYYSDDDCANRVVKVKRCVCLTNPENCPCHPFQQSTESHSRTNLLSNRKKCASASASQLSFKSDETFSPVQPNCDDLKLSMHSLATTCTNFHFDNQQKTEAYKSWCARKDKERKKAEEERARLIELKEQEKQKQLEVERDNFRRWVASKKKKEEKRKKEREGELEGEKAKEQLKEKRKMENNLKYQLWLKQKESVHLEKKLKDQIHFMKTADEKQKRLELSVRAYDDWRENSKYKPKPVPSNQGLLSLKTSVSVTYINPTPWVPNIDNKTKPTSQ